MEEKKDSLKNIKGTFQELLKSYKIDSRYQATLIKNSWEKLVGKPIASKTTQISLHNKKLKIKVNSAPLKNELNMSKTKILELLKSEFGDGVIEEVMFI